MLGTTLDAGAARCLVIAYLCTAAGCILPEVTASQLDDDSATTASVQVATEMPVADGGATKQPAVSAPPSVNAAMQSDPVSCSECAVTARCITDLRQSPRCVCPPETYGNGRACTPNDACKQLGCDPHAMCVERAGEKLCQCQPGFVGDGKTCTDIDDCAPEADSGCFDQKRCQNTVGSRICSCPPGYIDRYLDGSECVDSCTRGACDAHGTCRLVEADPMCFCTPPYVGNGLECHVDTQCTSLRCHPLASCKLDGAIPFCQCQSGYAGDGINCTDIDECVNRPCGLNAQCANTPGSFACRCNQGFDGDGQRCVKHDYCSPSPCYSGVCRNQAEVGYFCDCSGTDYTGPTCSEPVDDCSPDPCNGHGRCFDGVRTYDCSCDTGFSGSNCQFAN